MAYNTKDGKKKYENIEHGKAYDRSHMPVAKRNPLKPDGMPGEPLGGSKGGAEPTEGAPGGEQPIEQVVQEHGPAHHTEIHSGGMDGMGGGDIMTRWFLKGAITLFRTTNQATSILRRGTTELSPHALAQSNGRRWQNGPRRTGWGRKRHGSNANARRRMRGEELRFGPFLFFPPTPILKTNFWNFLKRQRFLFPVVGFLGG